MREIITINVGQAGINVGNSCWEQYCLEHGIQPDGQRIKIANTLDGDYESFEFKSIFSEIKDKAEPSYRPRSVFIDLEPTVIDEIRTGAFKQLFDAEQFVSGKEDTANNFARGHKTLGEKVIDTCLEKIRKLTENCQDLEGFIVNNSVSGGTGSGLGSLLLERLSTEYEKKQKLSFNIYPYPGILSTSALEPYNSVLATSSLIENTDLSFTLDNSALYDICQNILKIEKPSYSNMNELLVQAISTITTSIRHDACLNCNLAEFEKNLVPHKYLHFLTASHSPIGPLYKQDPLHMQLAIDELSDINFESTNTLAKCNLKNGLIMAGTICYRGNVIPKYAGKSQFQLRAKKIIKFEQGSQNSYRIGLNYQPPVFKQDSIFKTTDKACSMITNSTAIKEVFLGLAKQFDCQFQNRAFVHWYTTEGMEESELSQARENLQQLEKDYQFVCDESEKRYELEDY